MRAERLDHLSDDDLVERFKTTADPGCFAEVFRRHREAIFRCCYVMVRDKETAADLTQDVFVRALEGIGGYCGGSLRAWLITIARHRCISFFRTFRHHAQTSVDVEELAVFAGVSQGVESELAVKAMLATLNPRQAVCVKLFYYNGLTYQEIASLTGYSIAEVKTNLQTAKRRIRRSMSGCERQ